MRCDHDNATATQDIPTARDTVRDYPDSKAMQRTARTQARSQEIRSECVPELHTEEVLRNTQVFRTNERGNR